MRGSENLPEVYCSRAQGIIETRWTESEARPPANGCAPLPESEHMMAIAPK